MESFSIRLDEATKAKLEEIRKKLQAEHDARFGGASMAIGIGQVIRLAIHQLILADARAGE